MKKEYIKPTTRAFQIQAQTILAGSGVRSVRVNDVEQTSPIVMKKVMAQTHGSLR